MILANLDEKLLGVAGEQPATGVAEKGDLFDQKRAGAVLLDDQDAMIGAFAGPWRPGDVLVWFETVVRIGIEQATLLAGPDG